MTNAVPSTTPVSTPDLTFTGAELDQMFADLTSPQLFQKQATGALVPLIDPGVQKVILFIQARAKEKVAKET